MPALIRLATAADAPAIAEIYRPYCESTIISFELAAPSAEEMAQRIRKITEKYPWLVLTIDHIIAGYAYACAHRERAAYQWAVDTAVYVNPQYHRRGVGRALYKALFPLLALQGYYKAYAGVALPNPASEGLHEAVGFTPVGVYHRVGYKMGAWHDVRWYELTLQPERSEPEPPKPLEAILGTPGWQEALSGLDYYRDLPERRS